MNTIRLSIEEQVLYVILNRPEKHNAINLEMVEELEQAFIEGMENEAIRTIVVSGYGEKSFAAGGDLVAFHQLKTEQQAYPLLKRIGELLDTISNCPKVTIAAINGIALGGGAELLTAFDFRVASEHAAIGFIQQKIGLTTGWGGGTRLLALLGISISKHALLSGEVLPVNKWYDYGFVHHVYPQKDFQKEVQSFAKKCTQIHPNVVKAYKQMTNRVIDPQALREGIEQEIRTCAKLWEQEKHLRSVEAFLDSKKAD